MIVTEQNTGLINRSKFTFHIKLDVNGIITLLVDHGSITECGYRCVQGQNCTF